ncbi:MAG TPA: hypothetical protein EYO34_08210 [Candidatus Marinimicrobia bacterium]|nr:hypothetical protein [Candidatus Neomarinimicrobiota bacterium]
MNLNTLFTINIPVAGLFGLGFIFAPEPMLAPYGISADQAADSAMMARFFGAANFGYALLYWFMRDAAASDARTAVVKASALGFGVGCLVSIFTQMSGEIGLLGWSTVALYAFFAAAYGYFGFGKGAEA